MDPLETLALVRSNEREYINQLKSMVDDYIDENEIEPQEEDTYVDEMVDLLLEEYTLISRASKLIELGKVDGQYVNNLLNNIDINNKEKIESKAENKADSLYDDDDDEKQSIKKKIYKELYKVYLLELHVFPDDHFLDIIENGLHDGYGHGANEDEDEDEDDDEDLF